MLKHINMNQSPSPNVSTKKIHNFLEVMETRISQHFELEKEMISKIHTNEESLEITRNLLNSEYNPNESSNYIRLNNLQTQRTDLGKKYDELVKQRNKLNDECREMELGQVHQSYFSNLFAKGKITLEQVEALKSTQKSEKILTYRDWVIDF